MDRNGDRSKLLNFCITAILNVTFPHFITKEREEKAEVQNQNDEIEAGSLACYLVTLATFHSFHYGGKKPGHGKK